MKQTFSVYGMSCANCVRSVERAIGSVGGVRSVSVNLPLKTALVDYDCDKKDIFEAVEKAGYSLSQSRNKSFESRNRLIVCIVFFIPLMYVSMGVMAGLPAPHILHNGFISAVVQLILTVPILIACRKYFVSGFVSLKNKSANMDTLISIGSLASLIFGIVMLIIKGKSISHEVYFESAGTIFTFITIGKYLEDKAKTKSADAVNLLLNMSPQKTRILTPDGEKEIDTSLVKVGDTTIIRAGDTVAHDAVIIKGSCTLDQSAVTGESMPVFRSIGENIISGSVCTDGCIFCRAEKAGMQTTLNRIIAMVGESISSKAPVSRLADKISAVFVPVVCAAAILTFAVWMFTGRGITTAFRMAVSVLVISCPCALGLATPVAITAGMGKGANLGILFKNAESLEKLHEIKYILFDKTGTLTNGKPEVAASTIYSERFYDVAVALESASSHPLAGAVLGFCKDRGNKVYAENIKVLKGVGITGVLDSKNVSALSGGYALKNNLVKDENIKKTLSEYENSAYSTVIVFEGETPLASLGISDMIKESSADAIRDFKRMGITPVMITGDNESAAKITAAKIGIEKYYAGVLPEEKAKIAQTYEKAAMVGDGINDSPALASAYVGISVSQGSQIAVESADVVLTDSQPEDAVKAVKLSKAVMRNIRQNLFWAFFYNIAALPIAAGVLYVPFGIALTPMIASACMSLSSIFVVLNALRIKLFYKEKKIKMKKTIYIDGMMCEHCKMNVEKALSGIDGVESAKVNLKKNCAEVCESRDISQSIYKEKIESAGYKFIAIE